MLAVISTAFSFLLSLLCWISHRYNGLGDDNGSNILLFGWRFSPTLIAVIYIQVLSVAHYDIVRTEPFSKLARQGGAGTNETILQSMEPWWNTLTQGFRRRQNGGTVNILLVCTSLMAMLSTLFMSPLSSSLLISLSTNLESEIPFKRVTLASQPLLFSSSLSTYLHTTGQLFHNLSANGWNLGHHTVLPFWPSEKNLDYLSSGTVGTSNWTGLTTVFSSEYECTASTVARSFATKKFTAQTSNTPGAEEYRNGTSRMITSVFNSDGGCWYQIDETTMPKISSMVLHNKTVSWTRWSEEVYTVIPNNLITGPASRFSPGINFTTNSSYYSVLGHSGPTSPYIRFDRSVGCDNNDLILFAHRNWNASSYGQPPESELLANYTLHGWSCNPQLYMADILVDVAVNDGQFTVSFEEEVFEKNRLPVPIEVINVSHVLDLFHSKMWESCLTVPSFECRNLSTTLCNLHNDNFSIPDNHVELPQIARNIFRRFYAELLRSSLSLQGNTGVNDFQGKQRVLRKRVVVIQAVGITLAVLFSTNAILIILINRCSRHWNRPLKLESDPASVVCTITLAARGSINRANWASLVLVSKKTMAVVLKGNKYYTLDSGLQELAQEGTTSKNLRMADSFTLN